MATEQELAAMRQRVASLEAAETERTKAAAVANELAKHDLVSGAAAEQLRELLMPTLDITTAADGRTLVFNKSDYNPLAHVVAETLAKPEYGHYKKQPGTPAPAQPGAGAPRPAAATGSPASNVREILPGETFGAAIVRVATSKAAAQGDPRLDPSQPFGLRPLPR